MYVCIYTAPPLAVYIYTRPRAWWWSTGSWTRRRYRPWTVRIGLTRELLGFRLAFTRYCHYQYCMACIAIKDGRGDTLYCAIAWAVRGARGVPKRRGCLQIIVLILVQRPRTERMSCEGQALWTINPPPVFPTRLQYYRNTIAQYTTPLRPPVCMPYTIHYW